MVGDSCVLKIILRDECVYYKFVFYKLLVNEKIGDNMDEGVVVRGSRSGNSDVPSPSFIRNYGYLCIDIGVHLTPTKNPWKRNGPEKKDLHKNYVIFSVRGIQHMVVTSADMKTQTSQKVH